jgi:hypothetical protein
MPNNTDVIQKLCTIHSDVKNTNEKVNKIDEKVDKIDIILRGNGTSVGLCAKVKQNSTICDKFKCELKKLEKKYTIIAIVIIVLIISGVEGAKALLRFFIPAIP